MCILFHTWRKSGQINWWIYKRPTYDTEAKVRGVWGVTCSDCGDKSVKSVVYTLKMAIEDKWINGSTPIWSTTSSAEHRAVIDSYGYNFARIVYVKKPASESPYQILGISSNASSIEVKAAYRALALKYHPDRNNGSKESEDRFKRVKAAYEAIIKGRGTTNA